MLPSIALVRVEISRDRVVVIQEVHLPRGDWRAGGIDLHVAFGVPGPPLAVDVRLGAVSPGNFESRFEDEGEPVTVRPALHRQAGALALLGKPQMAGVAVRVTEAQLRRAFAANDVAALRIRSLVRSPAADESGGRDLVVRLGIVDGAPLTLVRIELAQKEPAPQIARAEALFCGPEANRLPLTVTVLPAGSHTRPVSIAPTLAVRHASDDLCIRWWPPVATPVKEHSARN
jgi:hypothetical protein